ncbi:MAG TPA: MFS transporter [Rickettsia endosymbiont of Sericostoma sp.]|nr:MFS transporter [Rickettsia endosymbiont of Sericostoma sp. HW-2014]HJD63501.1 MFS transporter [Rickettsia endosymbiont of Sericostoma sp.]
MSGFTLMIPGNTLNYWLAKENIDLQSIGMFTIILIPYSINFLWTPIFDTIKLGWLSKLLGHRLSWICLIQILLAATVFLLSTMNPHHSLSLFALVGLIISFLCSSKDTILGALRTEIITKESQGAASGIYIFGYRIGILISSSGAIYLSRYLKWNSIYKIFALFILLHSTILVMSILRLESYYDLDKKNYSNHKINISNFIQNILKPVGSFSLVFLIIIFLILYRLPDNFIRTMISPFLMHIGYDEFEIASTGKFLGTISSIIGGLIASAMMRKINILNSLLIFGIIHSIAHTLFILQEIYGKNLPLLFITVGFEGITGGMTMTAYIAFIASICQGKFRATQHSFFSSMMGFSRSIFPALSGYIVIQFGWQNFFTFIVITTIPSLLVLFKINSLLTIKK